MRLAVFQHQGQLRLGALLSPRVGKRSLLVDIILAGRALGFDSPLPASINAWLADIVHFQHSILQLLQDISLLPATEQRSLVDHGVLLDTATLTYLPPISTPGKIICVGMNYPVPAKDFQPTQTFPVLFLKPFSSLIGFGGNLILPAASKEIVAEVELALVIGRKGKQIPAQHALDYIAGYTLAIDAGARDWEARTSQWTSGKMGDTFTPMGPFLVTTDELDDPTGMELSLSVNSIVTLHGYVKQMIFGIKELLVYISQVTTLVPGDIILTGSPKVGIDSKVSPVILHHGDTLSAAAVGLGSLVVHVKRED
jgi:2-keto-4-pentenoate hydratase/2-oxohepta-3-ene-1,7-dioic acid hydratase in catechol pathway